MRQAQATARRTGQNISGSMQQMRVRTVQAFGAVRIAAAGLGVGLGVGVFVQQARQAFEFASSLTETARAIGVTAEQYQILTRAALENGASQEGMERAVGILNRTLGQARAGVPAAVQAFRALRIDPEQFTRAGDVIPVVMERIRNLRTESEQAAASQRLFGRGAAELIPFLVQGAAGYDRVAQAAREAGLVTAEQARRADEAADRLSILAHTLRVNLASALVDVLPYVENVIRALGRLGAGAQWAFGLLARLRGGAPASRFGIGGQSGPTAGGMLARVQAALMTAGVSEVVLAAGRGVQARSGQDQQDPAFAAWLEGQRGMPDTGDVDLDLSGGGGGGGGANTRDRALREAHEFQSQIRRHRMDLLRAQEGFSQDFEARYDLGRQIAAAERQQYESDVQLSVQLRERTQQQADLLMKGYDATAAAALQSANQELDSEYASRRQALAEREFDLASNALRQETDMADTASDRRRLELEMLDLTYRHRRAKLESIIAEQEAGRATRQAGEEARRELGQLGAERARNEQSVRRSTMGPLEQFLSDLPTTAARANEALQHVAANGLASITDGLTEAIMMTRSWGDVTKNVIQQILADLLRIQIQQRIIGPLTEVLSGLLPGAGLSWNRALPAGNAQWSQLANLIPGRAAGGPVIPGRTYRVGEKGPELLRMGSQGGVIIPNEAMGGGGIVINQTFAPNFAGNAATKQEMVQLAAMVKPMAQEAYRDMARRRR